MEAATAQLRVKPKAIIAEGSNGAIIWVTPTRARLLIASGAAELIIATRVGPSETKPAGPLEAKESLEKKLFDTGPGGLSTDFPKSNVLGTDAQSSALPADQALQPSNADTLKRRPGRPRKET